VKNGRPNELNRENNETEFKNSDWQQQAHIQEIAPYLRRANNLPNAGNQVSVSRLPVMNVADIDAEKCAQSRSLDLCTPEHKRKGPRKNAEANADKGEAQAYYSADDRHDEEREADGKRCEAEERITHHPPVLHTRQAPDYAP